MIRAIVRGSLTFRALVVGVAAVLLALGCVQLRHAPVGVYPEFGPPHVQIQTEALGLSAEEVEQLITVPLEQDLLNGVAWLDTIRSESMPGLSSIDLVFQRGTNVLRARQLVQERLAQPAALPNVGSRPSMIQPLSATSRLMMVRLSSTSVSPVEMSVLARWKIRPRLMGVPGVANVAIWGQRDRQLQVRVDPARLRKYGVTLDNVITTAGNALWVSPLSFVEASTPGTGGFIDTPTQRFGVQHVLPITTAESLAAVPLPATRGRTLRMGNVVTVAEGHQPLIGNAVQGAGTSLLLVVEKFPEANTLKVTRAVEDALGAMRPGLSGIRVESTGYRPATFVRSAVHDVSRSALIGSILLVLVLAALAGRAALVTLLAIPLSIVTAAYVLYLRGVTFNAMVLAGLVAATAVIVDDAVGDVDRLKRRLRADRRSGTARSATDAVVDTATELRGTIGYATVAILLATTPVLLLTGVAGSFGRPLVVSYALAVLASMAVALTVTPALAALLRPRGTTEPSAGPLARRLHRVLDRPVRSVVARPRRAYLLAGVLAVAGLVAVPLLPGVALPPLHDRDLLVQWRALPGTSLPEMSRITASVTSELRTVPGVRDVGAHVGRAVSGDNLVDVNAGELWVSLDPSADYGRTVSAISRVVGGYPGVQGRLLTYESDRVASVETRSAADVVVRVYGHDESVLTAKAAEISRAIGAVAGVVRPRVESVPQQPTVEVRVDLAAAHRYRVKPGDVRRDAATLVSGINVGNLYEDQKVFDVVVWGAPSVRRSPAQLSDLLIETPRGDTPLGDLASVRIRPNPTVIRHDATTRSLDVTAEVSGRGIGAVDTDIERLLRDIPMPLEHHAELLADATKRQADDRRIAAYAIAAAIGVFLLLQAALGSWRRAALLFVTLPLAGVGGLLAAWTLGKDGSLGAAIGLFAVYALALRQGVLLLRDYQRLEAAGGPASIRERVLAGTTERMTTVVVVTLAIAAAVLPLAVSGSVAGQEVLHPFAVVLLSGLASSLLLTTLVLPALYLRLTPTTRPSVPEPLSQPRES